MRLPINVSDPELFVSEDGNRRDIGIITRFATRLTHEKCPFTTTVLPMCLLYIRKNVTEMFILLNGQVVLD